MATERPSSSIARSLMYDDLPLQHNQRSFRLFSIDGIDATGIVNVSMHMFELEKRPHYCALSYTWRNPLGLKNCFDELHDFILCNGHQFMVLPNLLAALKMLARSRFRHEHFWIDALCIDQNSAAEKAAQIAIMPLLYRCADTVVIYLGPEDEDSQTALPLIEILAALKQEDRHKIRPQSHLRSDQTLGKLMIQPEVWRCLARFFCRAYFGRAWVVQEVIHATAVAPFCGATEVNWLHIVRVSELCSTTEWSTLFHRETFRGSHHVRAFHGGPAKIRASKFQRATEGEDILLYSLIRSRQYHCGDPRDKVFSVLSTSRQDFAVAYDAPVEYVYKEAAKQILRQRDDLLILGYAEGNDYRKVGAMPSWVPDWSVTSTLGLGVTGYNRYSAAPMQRLEPYIQGDTLLVRGEFLDTITSVGQSKQSVLDGEACTTWLSMIKSLGEDYTPSETVYEAFWRTLVNNTGSKYPIRAELGNCFVHWLARHLKPHLHGQDQASRNLIKMVAKLEGRSGFEMLSKNFDIDDHEADGFESHYDHTLCLRPFATTSGLLGAGTTSCLTGDSVFLVHGSRIPLILRWAKNAYQLIGGCYVHGAMGGEMISKTDVQTLEII